MSARNLDPIPGSETFGVPRRKPKDRIGRARMIPLDDAIARVLFPGRVLFARAFIGFHRVRVARVRESVYGEIGAQHPCVVIDARRDDGKCLTFAPEDLYRPRRRGEIEP